MKIIKNSIIPFKGFAAINLFGVLFVRKDVNVSERLINHEKIHSAQMKELFYVPFYVLYLIEWLIKLCFYGSKAYYNISFEREAIWGEGNSQYLEQRKIYAWVRLIV